MNHTALIGDIKGSRDIQNWPEVFQKLVDTLEDVNRKFADDILIPFQPTVGDEFQGALKTPAHAYDVYTFIKASLPVSIYSGMGLGEVEKSQEDDKGLRGSAFYRAREALEKVKRSDCGLRVIADEDVYAENRTVNTIIELIELHEERWTIHQKEIVSYFRLNPESKHKQAADFFKTTRQNITKTLNNIGYNRILDSETTLRELLRTLTRKM